MTSSNLWNCIHKPRGKVNAIYVFLELHIVEFSLYHKQPEYAHLECCKNVYTVSDNTQVSMLFEY